MKTIIAIVASLCKIHNWLIDTRLGPITTITLPTNTHDGKLFMAIGGVLPLEPRTGHSRQEMSPI